jgi:AraC-like DNA-binding protein
MRYSDMNKKNSTLTSFAAVIARAVETYAVDSEPLFQHVGLDVEAMKNPNARYPNSDLARLMQCASDASDDPAFGLTVARHVSPTTLHALGFSLLASESLHAAFLRLVRYYRIVSDAIVIELDKTKNDYRLNVYFNGDDTPVTDAWIDAGMATLVMICRWLHGDEFAPLRVCLSRPEPKSNAAFDDYFNCRIDYDSEHNSLIFEKSSVNKELPTGNAELAYQNDKIVSDYLARFDNTRLSERVRAIFIERLVTGKFSEEQIAEQLNLSLRSLQRRLRDEQTSYQQLLDETRLELSLQYINRTSLSVAQIAPLLGFSDSSNFNRAFKRWLGISPSKYRALGFQ